MRRPYLLGLAFALALSLLATESHAQIGFNTGADPFSLYYGFYLPRQQAIAAQVTPTDTLNAITATRQNYAVTDRSGLYDPISPYGQEDLDPLRPYSPKRGGERLGTTSSFGGASSNARGGGPSLYYNRTARYYPALRSGRGPNRNVAVVRGGRGGGFGGGMPSAPGLR